MVVLDLPRPVGTLRFLGAGLAVVLCMPTEEGVALPLVVLLRFAKSLTFFLIVGLALGLAIERAERFPPALSSFSSQSW